MSFIILNINLLNKIESKLKQPYNDFNLELSYSLNHRESYYIDSHLNYYLIKVNVLHINHSNTYKLKIFEFRFFKFLCRYIEYHQFIISYSIYNLKIHKFLFDYFPKKLCSLKIAKFFVKNDLIVPDFGYYNPFCCKSKNNISIAKYLCKRVYQPSIKLKDNDRLSYYCDL